MPSSMLLARPEYGDRLRGRRGLAGAGVRSSERGVGGGLVGARLAGRGRRSGCRGEAAGRRGREGGELRSLSTTDAFKVEVPVKRSWRVCNHNARKACPLRSPRALSLIHQPFSGPLPIGPFLAVSCVNLNTLSACRHPDPSHISIL